MKKMISVLLCGIGFVFMSCQNGTTKSAVLQDDEGGATAAMSSLKYRVYDTTGDEDNPDKMDIFVVIHSDKPLIQADSKLKELFVFDTSTEPANFLFALKDPHDLKLKRQHGKIFIDADEIHSSTTKKVLYLDATINRNDEYSLGLELPINGGSGKIEIANVSEGEASLDGVMRAE